MTGLLLYLVIFAAACAVGLPLGFALFGRRHAAAWIAGALFGYGLVNLALWATVQAGRPSPAASVLSAALLAAALWATCRTRGPWIELPPWTRRDTAALVLVLLLVPALQWRPFTRLGERDDTGARRYRAYFTADVLWHTALAAELGRFASPPRNPYLARRPLHYYWAYFVFPAVVAAQAPVLPDVLSHLLANAFAAGLLFLAAVFLFAWCVVPRAGPAAVGVACVLLAASAEGLYALVHYWSRGLPLSAVRELNIDAITAWWFGTLTIDSLPRSLWYTPQHATACALSLIALVVAARGGRGISTPAALAAGVALGLALIVSPFLGGAFSLAYGLAAAWTALASRSVAQLLRSATAALPVAGALAWCIGAGTFEGTRGSVAIGLSGAAARAPLALVGLAAGPVLAVALAGLLLRPWRAYPVGTAVIAAVLALTLLFFVTLTLEPVWIGWRAGQILLVTMPALVGAALARLWDTGRRTAAGLAVAAVLLVGLPTTIIDAWNAQDVSNTAEAAGFRWTLVVPPDTLAALQWIRNASPRDAIVQMSIAPRRRHSWTLIPTFGERRMAAGRPISLLHTPEYDQLSDKVDEIFRATDASAAARLARALRIDYLFVDDVERQAFGHEGLAKFDDPRYFSRTFSRGTAAVYAVR